MVVQGLKKALRVKRIMQEMATNKENRIREIVGLPPLETWWEQCKMGVCSSIRACLCRAFCPCCIEMPTMGEFCCPRGSFAYQLCTMGEYPHELLKSFLFFLLGLLLSMGIFLFFCLQLEVNMEFALAVSAITGLLLSVGLAFFNVVRCLVFLALPNFCSSRGRSFLIMYAMVLILNHPVQDFSHNLTVLSDSATCGQSLALNETKELVEAVASPILSMIAGIRTMLKSIQVLADELRKAFKALLRAVEEIVSVIGKVFSWLAGMTDVCNENMGKPYQKCKKVFEDGYRRCRRKLWLLKFMCSVVRLVGKVCYIARISELMCVIVDAVRKLVLDKVGPPVMAKIRDVREMFYFNVTMDYHFVYNMNQSRPYSEVREAIMAEIKAKLSVIDVFQAVVDNVMCFTLLLVVLNAVLYRRRFLMKDGYDNFYLTKRLFEIDARRTEQEKDPVFPLRARETLRFIPTFSYFMTEKEIRRLIKGLLFWLFGVFNASYYIVCDYGLYWVLDLVRTHMDFSTTAAVPPRLQLHVQGQGPMADMYKAMVGVVEPVADEGLDVDTSTCLPHPREPNYGVYRTVALVLTVTFFLTVLQAYTLRLQHIVANLYYPHRERARAVWLYNHILMTRDTFLVFTRKQVARKYKNEKDIEKFSFLSRLAATSKVFRAILKCLGRQRKYCLSCALEGAQEDMLKFTHCINCKSPYCNECFTALENVCTACMNPLDYGDIDGISVENDSSEDEEDMRVRVASIRDRKQKIRVQKKKEERDSKEVVQAFQRRFGLDNTEVEALKPIDADHSDYDDDDGARDGSTTSYDTDYQHRSADSSSDDGESATRRPPPTRRKRSERISMEILIDDFDRA